jgi:hypothetical protein
MIEDPRINFAVSQRGARTGVDHLGFQVDTDDELVTLRSRVADAQIAALDQPDATCCYARSDKYWITDPQGVAWETYRTLGEAEIHGVETRKSAETGACCSPRPEPAASANTAAAKCC